MLIINNQADLSAGRGESEKTMVNEKFRILKQNIKNTPVCDLPKNQLYNVSFMMTQEQLKEYADILYEKGIFTFEYGHAYIGNKQLY